MLYVVIDLLCRILYGANLPQDELNLLVESLAEYTVPSTHIVGNTLEVCRATSTTTR